MSSARLFVQTLYTLKSNKCPKWFDKRPHRRLITPGGCEWIRPILTPSNTWFLGPTWFRPQTVSRSVQRSAIFGQLTHVHNTQTDTQIPLRATCVAIGRISMLVCDSA